MTTKLQIEGMSCEMCVAHITQALQEIEGVKSAKVDLETSAALVESDGVSTQQMLAAVDEEGYTARVIG